MTATTRRKIVRIDEEKCTGCGVCIPACAEGALQIIDGKARLVDDRFCDGLGACLGECPEGAITVEEREAEEFDEELVKEHFSRSRETEEPCGCPSADVTTFTQATGTRPAAGGRAKEPSMLGHWPVQLALVPRKAPFLREADLVLAADCVPFAFAGFHREFLVGRALLVACPKLDDFQAHQQRLTDILRESGVRSVTVVHMEVPCCSGLVHMVRQAIRASRRDIPLTEVTIGIRGEILNTDRAVMEDGAWV